jgi:AcrR family transcriptional regulator
MTQRAYTSPLRAQAAEQTRRAILNAAKTLFAEQGYGRTSVAAVAAAAGVALNTVYTSVGAKPALILAMAREAAEDEQVERTVQQAADTADGREILHLTATNTSEMCGRYAETLTALLDARNNDDDVAAASDYAMRRYRQYLDIIADRLVDVDAVRPGIDRSRVRDIFWYYFGASSWATIRDLQWSLEEAASWLTNQAAEALLTTTVR